jgi:hypothetical protein
LGKKKGLTPVAKLGLNLYGKNMQNCIQTDKIGQGFWLHLRASGDGLEIAEYNLPTPNYYQRTDEASYTVAWLLNGYFGTVKGKAYLNDMIGRLSLGMKIANRLPYAPRRSDGRAYELKEFQNLPSLPHRSVQQLNAVKYDDAVFWAIKLESIAQIRVSGWLDHDTLKEWAFNIFVVGEHVRDRSTLKAKVRNVWQWYKDRDWKIDDRSFTMSRSEAGRKAHTKLAKDTEAKVRGAVEALKFLQEKITITTVSKQSRVHRNTVSKYLKKMGLIGGQV